jgi:hypothetical protein
MIVKMFEMIATGEARKANALAHLTRLGLTTVRGKTLNQQSAARVLTNGLYCGRMFAKKWNLTVPGDYVPLVSEDLSTGYKLCCAVAHLFLLHTRRRTQISR